MSKISIFKNTFDTCSEDSLSIGEFIDRIRDGYWQDYVLPVRAIADKKQRDEAKKKVPCVTMGGLFGSGRTDDTITRSSGFIGIDIDDVDAEKTKALLKCDEHIYAAFTSISGRGLCVVFRICAGKYRQAHAGLEQYLFDTYSINIDPTSVNPSRLRYVSFDPHLYINKEATKFTRYVEVTPVTQDRTTIFAKTDFDQIILEIQQRRVNLCESYHNWLRIGFALAEEFGEAGEHYFHIISSYSQKYNPQQCDKQWQNCLKGSRTSVKRAHMATFYYCCKQHGIETYSERTRDIIEVAYAAKRSGKSKEQVIQQVGNDPDGIVEQVFNANEIVLCDESLFGRLKIWMKANYPGLRQNCITRYIELGGKQLDQNDFNSIYIKANTDMKKINFENVDRLIRSEYTEVYNPLLDFFAAYQHRRPSGLIDRLFETIQTDEDKRLFSKHIGRKWLVSIIASAHGIHSPLMLVLSGSLQGTGKTEFFRRLLPPELQCYYAESKLDAGKDDEILMTKKLLIMDDEMGGKSKKDERRLKELLSKQVFSLREPYGRNNVDLNRLAVLCGTTNDNEILSDPTGNRRILPINVQSIDHQAYNAIDKIDLIMEAYHLYKAGFDWQLNREDINMLSIHSSEFENYSIEYELINKYYVLPMAGECLELTASEILIDLDQKTGMKLQLNKLGKELKRIGFEQVVRRTGKTTQRKWKVQAFTGFTPPGIV
ncbi:VapE domain-containing protein [Polluticoccus soli]|uniref:VapE domain-containing protein n=1 Tax=Polluticoccus soli TaxID=3034150 RepID=UPI0023E2E799|nr:VapE domain-containing protein [Flavipsychrobacter sp. JY13-12]